MTVLDAAYWVICAVLVVSGLAKFTDPAATESTLRSLGVRVPGGSGRVLGAVEVLLGAAGLVTDWWIAGTLVSLLYLGFAAVVDAARRAGLEDCGCLGVRRSRPTGAHVAVNVVSAVVAALASFAGPVALADGLGSLEVVAAVAVGVAVAVAAGLVIAWEGA
jgi:hypothetical protein